MHLAAELLASMYDASLDAFAANYWGFNIYPYYHSRLNWTTDNSFQVLSSNIYEEGWNIMFQAVFLLSVHKHLWFLFLWLWIQ